MRTYIVLAMLSLCSNIIPVYPQSKTNLLDKLVDLANDNFNISQSYSNDEKCLGYVSASFLKMIGVSLYIDLVDYCNLSTEGQQGWVTIWIDGSASAGIGLPGSFGITKVDISSTEKDPRRKFGISMGSTTVFGYKASFVKVDDSNEFDWASSNIIQDFGLSVSLASLSKNLYRCEINKNILNSILNSSLNGMAKNTSLDVLNIAKNTINKLVNINTFKISPTVLLCLNSRDFTSLDDGNYSLEDGAFTYFGRSMFLNMDAARLMYFPEVTEANFWNNLTDDNELNITFNNIGTNTTDYYVIFEEYTPSEGWLIGAKDYDIISIENDNKFDISNLYPRYTTVTRWHVGVTTTGDDSAKFKFSLYQDRTWPLADKLLDCTVVTFYKDNPDINLITASAGNGGKITPEGIIRVKDNENISFTLSPDPNFSITSMFVNGSPVGAISSYVFYNVTNDQSISATFYSTAKLLKIIPTDIDFGEILTPKTERIDIHNDGISDLNWSSSTVFDWLSTNKSSGTIPPGGSDAIYVTADPRLSGAELGEAIFADLGIKNTGNSDDYSTIFFRARYGGNSAPRLDFDDIYSSSPYSDIYEGDTISFVVTYSDPDVDPPSFILIYIDETPHYMDISTGNNYQSGVDYIYTTTDLTLGSHSFRFYCKDINGAEETEPYTGTFNDLFISAAEPSIEILRPDKSSLPADSSFLITWNATGSNIVDLYYDDNINRLDGTILIEKNVTNNGEYSWDISKIEDGIYYVCGVVSNVQGVTEYDYSPLPLTINHSQFVPNKSWMPEIQLNSRTNQSYNLLYKDQWGILHAFWGMDGIKHKSSPDNGLTFAPVDTPLQYPGKTISSAFDIAVFNEKVTLMYYTNDGLFVINSVDTFQTWGSPITIGDTYNYLAKIQYSGNDLYVMYSYQDGSQFNLGLKYSGNDGINWQNIGNSAATNIDVDWYGGQHSFGFYIFNSVIYVVYVDKVSDNVFFRKSMDLGSSWSSPLAIFGSDFIQGTYPEIYANDLGIYIFASGKFPSSSKTQYFAFSNDGGSSWDVTSLGSGQLTSYNYSFSVHDSTIFYLNDNTVYLMSRNNGKTWSNTEAIELGRKSRISDVILNEDAIYAITYDTYQYFIRTVPENTNPSILITQPSNSVDTINSEYTIKWDVTDPDFWQNPIVSLYYSTDTIPSQVRSIYTDTLQDSQFTWNISNVQEGNYYIYAVVEDGAGGLNSDLSAGQLYVNHSPDISFDLTGFDTVNQSYWIKVSAFDKDISDSLRISIFYDSDTNATHLDTIVIDTNSISQIKWTTSSLPDSGSFYLYGVVSDGINHPIFRYSSGQVFILHNDPPSLLYSSISDNVMKTIADTLDIQVIIADNDGDSIDYTWTLNGNILEWYNDNVLQVFCSELGISLDTLELSFSDGNFIRNKIWYLTITESSGVDNLLFSDNIAPYNIFPVPVKNRLTISASSKTGINIYNLFGENIKTFIPNNNGYVEWNLKDNKGTKVNKGIYLIKIGDDIFRVIVN